MQILAFLIAYLIGSVSSASIIARIFYGKDIKTLGSGNAGATNVLRFFGKKAALATFLLDFLKAIIAILIAKLLDPNLGPYLGGLGAVLGHTYPIYFKFKGGKGVATGLGVISYFDIKIAALLLLIFIVIVLITRYVSLGSVLSVGMAPIIVYFKYYEDQPLLFYTILCLVCFIIFNHRSNIKRLINKNERKLGRK